MRRLAALLLAFAAPLAAHAQSTSGNVTFNLHGQVFTFISAQTNQPQTYGASEAVRFFPNPQFQTTSGFKFGLYADIREGANTGPSDLRPGTVYSRRLYAYAGSPDIGTFRLGTVDGASADFQTGTFDTGATAINDGGWNGVAHYITAPGFNPAFPFASSRFYYATNKLEYQTPRWNGLEAAASFEPSVTGTNLNGDGSFGENTNSDYVDAQNLATPGPKRRDTLDIAARYSATFGDATAIASASYITSGRTAATGPTGVAYRGLNLGTLGASVDYAGFTFGGMVQRGKFNGTWELAPETAKDSTAYSVGLLYRIAAYTAGVSYFNYRSPGDVGYVPTGTRLEQGVAAGGSYVLSNNVTFYADYLFGSRRQSGYDFETGMPDTYLNNSLQTQTITLGGRFNW